MDFKSVLDNILGDSIYRIVVSSPKKRIEYIKIEINILGNDKYQIASFTPTKVFHKNVTFNDIYNFLMEIFLDYKQYNLFDDNYSYHIMNNSGKIKLSKTKNEIVNKDKFISNDRTKNYILKEGELIQPLLDMGIFTKDGKVINSMYDKFKQINRFIEIIDDEIKDYKEERINIIDFGCGKSYLTFVLYHYLVNIRNIDAHIVGLDLKKEVIDNCNVTAKKYNYDNLSFKLGDIKDYIPEFNVDMVVTLHACDTATDIALYNAIKWDSKYIFSVPCCQHELNNQIESETLPIITRYGIAKERISALYTDIIRCNMLKYMSYQVQLLEFVDLSHTPKNLLIRAKKTNISVTDKDKYLKEVEDLNNTFNLKPTL